MKHAGAAGLRKVPLASWGMSLAHFGLGVTALGIAVVSTYGYERDAVLRIGEPVEFAGYEWQLEEVRDVQGPNYFADEGLIRVSRDGEAVTELRSQKRAYTTQQAAMTEAGIAARLDRDLFAALGEPLGEDAWSVRLQVKPLVRFIWLGAIFMGIGGLLAAFDRRYRRRNGRGAD